MGGRRFRHGELRLKAGAWQALLHGSGADAMIIGMALRGGRRARTRVLLRSGALAAMSFVSCGIGCRRVQAPLTEVAPVPGLPFVVPVDLSHPEQHLAQRPLPSAEEAARGLKVVKVAEAVSSTMLARRPVNHPYPAEARERHLQGKVVFRAIVDEDGTVKGLTVLEQSDPVFVPAAVATIQGWQYQPYLLQGRAVAMDTTITVNFNADP